MSLTEKGAYVVYIFCKENPGIFMKGARLCVLVAPVDCQAVFAANQDVLDNSTFGFPLTNDSCEKVLVRVEIVTSLD